MAVCKKRSRLGQETYAGAYMPPQEPDIVDVMMKIMDDGPKPMKNLRPSNKHCNGADKFWLDHQAAYEARGEPTDLMTRVHLHNSGYPKMRDELDRRRSMCNFQTTCLGKALKMSTPNQTRYDPKCQACIKLKKLSELKKMNLKPKCRCRDTPKCRKTRSRITKSKSRSHRNTPIRIYGFSRAGINKSCQCSYYPLKNKKSAATSDISSVLNMEQAIREMDSEMPRQTSVVSTDYNTAVQEILCPVPNVNSNECLRNESESNIDSGNPDTSEPSISSYNSYMSMDHEPMVPP